jgi:RP/EB family microtubule-associated protein
VGRKEILEWINVTCELNLSKIEDTASGAVSCLLLDIMYPGQVPLHRVNWAANKSFEYVGNYKILQTAFTKLKIDRHIDVDRLISGRAMDNLEFMQWFKRYFEIQSGTRGADYDPAVARGRGKGGSTYRGAVGASSGGGAGGAPTITGASARSATAPAAESRRTGADKGRNNGNGSGNNKNTNESNRPTRGGKSSAAGSGAAAVSGEVVALKRQALDMKVEMDGLEKERDFYFNKLRDIEIMLQDVEDSGKGTPLTADIFKVLYATADGFVQSPSAASVASQHMSPQRSASKGLVSSSSKDADPNNAIVTGSAGKPNPSVSLFNDNGEGEGEGDGDYDEGKVGADSGDDDDDMLSPGAPANNPFRVTDTP